MTFVAHAAHRTARGFTSLFAAFLLADNGFDIVTSNKVAPPWVPTALISGLARCIVVGQCTIEVMLGNALTALRPGVFQHCLNADLPFGMNTTLWKDCAIRLPKDLNISMRKRGTNIHLIPVRSSPLGGWHTDCYRVIGSVVYAIASRALSSLSAARNILFQRHAALLDKNNAECLMSGIISGI